MTERIYKAEGLVLRHRALGEADRLVTILTPEKGKFAAVARGARKIRSRLAAGVDLFTHGRYSFYRGKTWPTITGQDVIERFDWFREDPSLYAYGVYMSEVIDHIVSGEEACPEIFSLLLEGWRSLGEKIDRSLLCRAFELKLASAAGYSPNLGHCSACGASNAPVFSPRQGSLLCEKCRENDAIKFEPGSIALARHLVNAPFDQLSRIRSTVDQKKDLARLTSSFYACHIDLGTIKSRRLLPE